LGLGRAIGAAALLWALPGCGLPYEEPSDDNINNCSSAEECGGSGACAGGICVATRADLTGLVIQVEIPAGAPYAGGMKALYFPGDNGVLLQGNASNGFVLDYSPIVNQPATVDVHLRAATTDEACAVGSTDGVLDVPIDAYLHPADQLPDGEPFPVGISIPPYEASSDDTNDQIASLNAPLGDYDVYAVPRLDAAQEGTPACTLPPLLLPATSVASSNLVVNVDLADPDVLQGSISGLNLGGWTLDVVDNDDGRLISTVTTFQTISVDNVATFDVKLWHSAIRQQGIDAIIRLTPPDSEKAKGKPTVLWQLDAVDLDGDLVVGLDVSALAAKTKDVSATVLDALGEKPIPATVAIQSVELLDGDFGTNAAFRTTATTDDAGNIAVTLLPGTYQVVAVPAAEPQMAITETTWEINDNTLSTLPAIIIEEKSTIAGDVSTPTGQAAFDLQVFLQPATAQAQSYVETTLNTGDVSPGTAIGYTDGMGEFAVPLDPGKFDLSIKPPASSGYPWLARARITIQGTHELNALAITNPVILEGMLLGVDGTPVRGALLRAWLPPSGQSAERPTVIQIGEAESDESGRYKLALPASISE